MTNGQDTCFCKSNSQVDEKNVCNTFEHEVVLTFLHKYSSETP